MEGNPYAHLIAKLREDAKEQMPVFYRLGKVISTNPLKVEVGGTVQEKADLLRNNSLYIGEEKMKLKKVSDGEETEYYPPDKLKLSANDTVLVLPIDEEQRFIILCKVV